MTTKEQAIAIMKMKQEQLNASNTDAQQGADYLSGKGALIPYIPRVPSIYDVKPDDPIWTTLGKGLANVPSGVANVGVGTINSLMHPLQTLGSIAAVPAGGLENAASYVLPNAPDTAERIVARNVGNKIAQYAGDSSAFVRDMAQDPSILLSLTVPGALSKFTKLSKVSEGADVSALQDTAQANRDVLASSIRSHEATPKYNGPYSNDPNVPVKEAYPSTPLKAAAIKEAHDSGYSTVGGYPGTRNTISYLENLPDNLSLQDIQNARRHIANPANHTPSAVQGDEGLAGNMKQAFDQALADNYPDAHAVLSKFNSANTLYETTKKLNNMLDSAQRNAGIKPKSVGQLLGNNINKMLDKIDNHPDLKGEIGQNLREVLTTSAKDIAPSSNVSPMTRAAWSIAGSTMGGPIGGAAGFAPDLLNILKNSNKGQLAQEGLLNLIRKMHNAPQASYAPKPRINPGIANYLISGNALDTRR